MFKVDVFGSSSKGNCYLLTKGNSHILIECGIPRERIIANLIKQKLNLNSIDFCLVSHIHKDHCQGLSTLQKRINCFSNKEVKEKFPSVEELFEWVPRRIGNFLVTAIPVQHGSVKNYAYIIEDNEDKLLFATDFNLCEYDISDKFTQVMIECNFLEAYVEGVSDIKVRRQINTHMGLTGLKVHLKELNLINCKQIYLMHLSDGFSDEIIMRAQIRNMFQRCEVFVCQKNGGVL